jgi:spore germination cell wall hydrolase CwlJ-like protein
MNWTHAIVAAIWLTAGVGGYLAFQAGAPARAEAALRTELAKVMGDVDIFAGLATAPATGRPTVNDRKRAEARVCLALNAYHEARGEAWEGQVAVGQVALRRAGLDPLRVCREIYRPEQFSWTTGRPHGGPLPTGPAWSWAVAAADAALAWADRGEGPDHSRGATYFHARTVTPYWTRGLELVAVLDNHRFYR